MKEFISSLRYLLLSVLILPSCQNQRDQPNQQTQQVSQQRHYDPAARSEPVYEFNMSDKSITTNGNLIVAASKIMNSTPTQVWQAAQPVSPAKITKSPYSSLGKLCKLTGSVYKVEEFPPTPNLTGQWAEVLMLAGNPNSPLGTTTVDFMYNGDIDRINANTYITCAGYFIGTYESQNAMGGTVEGVVIVGNSFRNGY